MLSVSLPEGLTFPQSTSQSAFPLSIPPCHASTTADISSPNISISSNSMILPVSRTSTVFSKYLRTRSIILSSSSLKRKLPPFNFCSLSSPAARPITTIAILLVSLAFLTISFVSGISSKQNGQCPQNPSSGTCFAHQSA